MSNSLMTFSDILGTPAHVGGVDGCGGVGEHFMAFRSGTLCRAMRLATVTRRLWKQALGLAFLMPLRLSNRNQRLLHFNLG